MSSRKLSGVGISGMIAVLALSSCSDSKIDPSQPAAPATATASGQQPVKKMLEVSTIKVPKGADGKVTDVFPPEPVDCELLPGSIPAEAANTPLGKAVASKNAADFKAAIRSSNELTAPQDAWALSAIVSGGCTELLKVAIAHKVDPWQGDINKAKVVAYDAVMSRNPELVDVLMNQESPQNPFVHQATDFMRYSMCFQPWSVIEKIVANGGELFDQDPEVQPAIVEVARCGQLSVLREGLAAWKNKGNSQELLLLHTVAAVLSSQDSEKVRTAHLTAIQYLLDEGIDPDVEGTITFPNAAGELQTLTATSREFTEQPGMWPEVAELIAAHKPTS